MSCEGAEPAQVAKAVNGALSTGGGGAPRPGRVDKQLEDSLADLQLAMAMGPNEAKRIRDEVISAAYKCAAARSCMPDGF